MMVKKKAKKVKSSNFPLFFDEGVREIADRRAEEDHRGNLTAYLNALVKADGKKHSPEKKK